MSEEIKPPGRATDYTPELRDTICRMLATGMTLRAVCRQPGIPDRQTIYNWLHNNMGSKKDAEGNIIELGFFDHYQIAREIGLDEFADETIDIADDGTNDFVEYQARNGKKFIKMDKEAVMRSKLRVDTRAWYLKNMMPRKYGITTLEMHQQYLDRHGDKTNPPGSIDEATQRKMESYAEAIEKFGKDQPDGEI